MTWHECKAILEEAQRIGYGFMPMPRSTAPGVREPYRILVYDQAGGQLDTAQGQTWTEAARQAVAIVARDQRRRAA